MYYLQETVCWKNGHRCHMNKLSEEENDKDEAALADHLKIKHSLSSTDDFYDGYIFTILPIDPLDLDKSEQQWVSKLVTMTPNGLNI